MFKAYKYRIYPSEKQKAQINQHFDACRLVWNLALEVKTYAWQSARVNVSRFDLEKQLVALKKEYLWMYDVNAQSYSGTLLNLDKAFNNFFKKGGYPNYKKKGSKKQSFQCPQAVKIKGNLIFFPKIRWVRCDNLHVINGQIKTVTVSKSNSGKYFVSVLVDNKMDLPDKKNIRKETTIGVDLGVKSFAITSAGITYPSNRFLKKSINRIKLLQKRASKKKQGSNNRKKANIKVASLYEKISNQRNDYIHKITSELIRDSQTDTLVIEDLNISGMKQNRKLSQAISDSSFGEFRRQITYKCEWAGKNLIVINRFSPSSKRCSSCGEINAQLTLSDREWACKCGYFHNRDLNAAINIRYYGLEKIFTGGQPG